MHATMSYCTMNAEKNDQKIRTRARAMKIGYIRVSRDKQATILQEDAMKREACERTFTDKMTGQRFDRTELLRMLDMARLGDVIVVWQLDRLEHVLGMWKQVRSYSSAFFEQSCRDFRLSKTARHVEYAGSGREQEWRSFFCSTSGRLYFLPLCMDKQVHVNARKGHPQAPTVGAERTHHGTTNCAF